MCRSCHSGIIANPRTGFVIVLGHAQPDTTANDREHHSASRSVETEGKRRECLFG